MSIYRKYNTSMILSMLVLVFTCCPTFAYADEMFPQAYIGKWVSHDDAFGGPAKSELEFVPTLNNKFVKVDYKITSTVSHTEVFAGNGFYQLSEPGNARGNWFDSNGDMLSLSAKVESKKITSNWGEKETKRGRTIYELKSDDGLKVTDYIYRDEKYALFNQAHYVKKEGAANNKATVNGIGGLFFKVQNTKEIALWYEEHLGIDQTPQDYDTLPWIQSAGPTVFAPFGANTTYFGDDEQQWMVNFRVDDLDKIAEQLRQEGIEVVIDETEYPNGRFARLKDPAGNPIELWEPK
jgi:catechol 2,3-dioxygenase-like lactoylglutathione lyase family enzyme